MVNPSDIVILILSTSHPAYEGFINACRNTWVKKAENCGFKIFFYKGDCEKVSIKDNTICLTSPDNLEGTSRKLIDVLKVVDGEIDYKFIFRTNLSSYIYPEKLFAYIKKNESSDLYAGVVGDYFKGLRILNRFDATRIIASKIYPGSILNYASGSGFWLSRNNVGLLINDKNIRYDYIDDNMVGYSLDKYKIPIVPALRVGLEYSRIVCPYDYMSDDFKNNCYHVRLKSSDRSQDTARFYLLDSRDFFDGDFWISNLRNKISEN